MPSVVSMPPNTRTAAFDTTSLRLSSPAPAAAASSEFPRVPAASPALPPAITRRRLSLSFPNASDPLVKALRARPAPALRSAPTPPAAPAPRPAPTAPAARARPIRRPGPRPRRRSGRTRTRSPSGRSGPGRAPRRRPRPPAVRPGRAAARPGPRPRTRRPAARPRPRRTRSSRSCIPASRKASANGVAMTLVLGAVQRQHARPDHPGGREPGVVDGERPGVAQDAQGQVAARDQPAAENREPGHRLALAQPPQQRMQLAAEIAHGHGRAERERVPPARLRPVRAGRGLPPGGVGRAGHAPTLHRPRRPQLYEKAGAWPAEQVPSRAAGRRPSGLRRSEQAEQPARAGHRRPGGHAPLPQLAGRRSRPGGAPPGPRPAPRWCRRPSPGRPPPGARPSGGRRARRRCAPRTRPRAAAATGRAAPSTTSTNSGNHRSSGGRLHRLGQRGHAVGGQPGQLTAQPPRRRRPGPATSHRGASPSRWPRRR